MQTPSIISPMVRELLGGQDANGDAQPHATHAMHLSRTMTMPGTTAVWRGAWPSAAPGRSGSRYGMISD